MSCADPPLLRNNAAPALTLIAMREHLPRHTLFWGKSFCIFSSQPGHLNSPLLISLLLSLPLSGLDTLLAPPATAPPRPTHPPRDIGRRTAPTPFRTKKPAANPPHSPLLHRCSDLRPLRSRADRGQTPGHPVVAFRFRACGPHAPACIHRSHAPDEKDSDTPHPVPLLPLAALPVSRPSAYRNPPRYRIRERYQPDLSQQSDDSQGAPPFCKAKKCPDKTNIFRPVEIAHLMINDPITIQKQRSFAHRFALPFSSPICS